MASVEESVESAIKQGLLAAGVTDDIRAFFLSDEVTDREDRIYPFVGIVASPAVGEYQQTFKDVPVEVVIATSAYKDHDPKRVTLKTLYETVRGSIDADDFDQYMPVGQTCKLIVDGGESGINNFENSVTLNITARTCGS